MNERENFLKTLEFRNPQWIPFSILLAWPLWHKYREDLVELVSRHPKIFGQRKTGPSQNFLEPTIPEDFDGDPGPGLRKGEYFRDDWGCVWSNTYHGLQGQVVESPLADWKALDTYQPPDPERYGQRGWDSIKIDFEDRRKRELLTRGWGGSLFDRLYYLRGFENLMIDIGTDDPHLPQLINC